MHIDYVARKDVDLDDATRAFVEKKLKKVVKYFNDILEIRCELTRERHLYSADLYVKGKDFDIKSTATGKELTTAIQEAVDKLEIQARRAKTRLKERKRPASGPSVGWQVEVIEPESLRTGTPRIVKTSTIPIKPMTIEEAALQLQESRNDFIVFRNAADDRINVLYRRRDDNLGLITPEF